MNPTTPWLLGIAVTLAGSSGHPLAQERHREQA
jgi:hypothetical protein